MSERVQRANPRDVRSVPVRNERTVSLGVSDIVTIPAAALQKQSIKIPTVQLLSPWVPIPEFYLPSVLVLLSCVARLRRCLRVPFSLPGPISRP